MRRLNSPVRSPWKARTVAIRHRGTAFISYFVPSEWTSARQVAFIFQRADLPVKATTNSLLVILEFDDPRQARLPLPRTRSPFDNAGLTMSVATLARDRMSG
jgi:hypothetical protein